ncbi:alpha/beta hydrolase domain-containing protein [Kineococcus rhizosphaerae]|uniref:Alpha/beta hydrolase domain-containing protein n=1 Tax=Kineococcus rhizosphaerae TaxID=559628 RepID=A0A2T0R154_9ACTN|nr:alpha/beta hydrolase domain-containing protein [Kineococcus rhizosphaerae]PRY13054.1 hypothetical protein CLV37_109245 [Kineococcus rhizosphaerae]
MTYRSVAPIRDTGSVPFGTAHLPDLAMGVDLAAHGYVEEELLLSGAAAVWHRPVPGGEAVPRAVESPFRTRVLVRRPAEAATASGFTLLEPLHPDLDSALVWNDVHPWLLREGHAWVGVTAFAHLATQLREEIDPERYADLDLPHEGQQYDVLAAAVRALAAGDLLGPVAPGPVVLAGMSATGSTCRVFLQDGFHERCSTPAGRRLVDGYLIAISSGGAGAAGYPPLSPGDAVLAADDARRTVTGHGAVVVELLSETESETHGPVLRADGDETDDRYRLVQVAGTAHVEARPSVLTNRQQFEDAGGRRPAFAVREPLSDARFDLYARAALAALRRWITDDVPAPRADRLHLRPGAEELERDEDGTALGGVRPPWVQVPLAVHLPHGTASEECEPPPPWMPFSDPEALARLVGTVRRFPLAETRRRYGTRAAWLRRFAAATGQQVAAGWLLAEDGTELLHHAPERWRG